MQKEEKLIIGLIVACVLILVFTVKGMNYLGDKSCKEYGDEWQYYHAGQYCYNKVGEVKAVR